METNLPSGVSVFARPLAQHRRMRTRVACLFPKEASLLTLVSARLTETSAEWETENGLRILTQIIC